MQNSSVPEIRIRSLTDVPTNPEASWVVYWMTAYRRSSFNFSLDRALDWCEKLQKPLLILEAIRIHYDWASQRFHRFVLDGMLDNREAFANTNCIYYPYVERKPGEGTGLVETLSKQACVLITDDFPCFFHPTLYAKVVSKFPVHVELVDSNGVMPMRAGPQTFTVAHSYRRFMQKTLPAHLKQFPSEKPFQNRKIPKPLPLPKGVEKRWPMVTDEELRSASFLSSLAIDPQVAATNDRGGSKEAQHRLKRFLDSRLPTYDQDRNEPDKIGSSELSPHLHFGHLSAHEIFAKLMKQEGWSEESLSKPNGSMNGFWNVSESAEAFLDQLLTWREIGFNMCWREPNYDRYESLPNWARETLAIHAKDPRQWLYELDRLEFADTHDPLWNAAQRQLVRDGKIHNYLRMLWGKKILHWTSSPEKALEIMIHLNNKYALDGRDPNSYSGIFWVLGRYDRAWGPERPIFGKVRYMTSESTANKWHVKEYLKQFA